MHLSHTKSTEERFAVVIFSEPRNGCKDSNQAMELTTNRRDLTFRGKFPVVIRDHARPRSWQLISVLVRLQSHANEEAN